MNAVVSMRVLGKPRLDRLARSIGIFSTSWAGSAIKAGEPQALDDAGAHTAMAHDGLMLMGWPRSSAS